MAFWNESTLQPKRNYRFKVTINGYGAENVIWWAKSFKPPSYEVSETTHDYLDNKYYFPGRVTWGDCSMVLVDPVSPNAVKLTNDILINSGYKVKTGTDSYETISRNGATQVGLQAVQVEVLDPKGDWIEKWVLQNAFIKSVTFSDLAYDNDELRTIDISFRYDWAVCSNDGSSEEQFGTGA